MFTDNVCLLFPVALPMWPIGNLRFWNSTFCAPQCDSDFDLGIGHISAMVKQVIIFRDVNALNIGVHRQASHFCYFYCTALMCLYVFLGRYLEFIEWSKYLLGVYRKK